MTATLLRPAVTDPGVTDLGARRRAGDDVVARLAAAPVQHVTAEFLAALNCREPELPVAAAPVRVLHAV